jgi:DNA-binding transcriptional ArsR family regulator
MPPTTAPPVNAVDAARLHLLFSNPTRVAVCRLLAERGESTVGRICEALGVEQTALSHHLALMRQGGVVDTRRDGRTIVYSLADGARERLGPLLLFPLGATA